MVAVVVVAGVDAVGTFGTVAGIVGSVQHDDSLLPASAAPLPAATVPPAVAAVPSPAAAVVTKPATAAVPSPAVAAEWQQQP